VTTLVEAMGKGLAQSREGKMPGMQPGTFSFDNL